MRPARAVVPAVLAVLAMLTGSPSYRATPRPPRAGAAARCLMALGESPP